MNLTEIKKLLYKQKPIATLESYDTNFVNYKTSLEDGTVVNFKIPYEESLSFWTKGEDGSPKSPSETENAQLLIRWLSI